MTVINFSPVSEKEQKLANFFAQQEISDFDEIFTVFRKQCELSYMFKDVDFETFYKTILANAKKKYFVGRDTLNVGAVKAINNHYAKRFDIDEFYEKYINDHYEE